MGAALVAYLVANPQILTTVAGDIVGLLMSHQSLTDADKNRLTEVIGRLDVLKQHELDIINGR